MISKYNKEHDCPFCNINKTKIENKILDETKYFYITPTLGSIVDGYILITTKRHVNSMVNLNIEELEEYKILIEKYREIFKNIYKKYPIIFEHGTPNLEENKASSVIHAHTHIVNHNYKNENTLLEELNFNKTNKIAMDSKNNYIFYINSDGEKYITYNFKPISQFMRIEIAKDLNMLDKYDWRKNNFDDNIILTVTKIKEYFNNKRK